MHDQLELIPTYTAQLDGKILANAHAVGDVDGDGATELLFGSILGTVSILKIVDDQLVRWRSCEVNSSVTSICLEHANDCDSRIIVATAEGACFVFRSVRDTQLLQLCLEFKVALNICDIAYLHNELCMATCNGNVSVYRPRHGDSGELLDYTQVAEMEIKEEIEALFEWPSDSSNPDVSSQLFARCSSGKFFSIRGQSSANAFHTQHINLLDGPPHDDDGITFVVGDIALDDERGMIALVSMNGLVSMLSSSGERKWSFQLPEAVVNADKLKMTAPSGKPADAIVACTWSGQVYVIQGEQKFVPFRMVLPSCSMFCVNIHDIVQISPTIVGISTSGTVLVYRGVQETLLRILQDFTLAKEVKRSAVFAQLDSPEKREAVLKKLRDAFPDSALSTETVAPSMEDVIKAMLAAPVQP